MFLGSDHLTRMEVVWRGGSAGPRDVLEMRRIDPAGRFGKKRGIWRHSFDNMATRSKDGRVSAAGAVSCRPDSARMRSLPVRAPTPGVWMEGGPGPGGDGEGPLRSPPFSGPTSRVGGLEDFPHLCVVWTDPKLHCQPSCPPCRPVGVRFCGYLGQRRENGDAHEPHRYARSWPTSPHT